MKTEIQLIVSAVMLAAACVGCSGCMQLTGADRIKWGTFEIVSNKGFELSAGAMQYDGAKNQKVMSSEVEREQVKGGK